MKYNYMILILKDARGTSRYNLEDFLYIFILLKNINDYSSSFPFSPVSSGFLISSIASFNSPTFFSKSTVF